MTRRVVEKRCAKKKVCVDFLVTISGSFLPLLKGPILPPPSQWAVSVFPLEDKQNFYQGPKKNPKAEKSHEQYQGIFCEEFQGTTQ